MKRTIILVFFSLLLAATSSYAQTDTTSGWQVVLSKPKLIFTRLVFPTKDTGYAFASDKLELLLFRSTNQGLTWDSIPTVVPTQELNTTFTTGLIGFCLGGPDLQTISRTTDGGNTWNVYPENANASGPIAFANKDTGVVFGTFEIARTTDGGDTWNVGSEATGREPDAASFGDSKTGYAVGSTIDCSPIPTDPQSGYCEKTTDGGASWHQICTGIQHELRTCYATSANTLFVGCDRQSVGRTTDGGATWSAQNLVDNNSGFFSIHFADDAHGMVAGNDDVTGVHSHGILFSTVDGGKTWQKQFLPPNTPDLNNIFMLNDSVALICGGSNIYRTTTGGNFSAVSQPPTADFQVQIFPNPTPGVVTIQYQLPVSEQVSFRFYDALGATLQTIPSQTQSQGTNQITFDGSSLANGVYYFQLTTPEGSYNGQFTIEK